MHIQFYIRSIIVSVSLLVISSCTTTPENTDVIQPVKTEETRPSIASLQAAKDFEQQQQWQQAFIAWKSVITESNETDKPKFINQAALMLYQYDKLSVIPNFYTDFDIEFNRKNDVINKNTLLSAAYFHNGKTYQSLSTLPDITTILDNKFLKIAFNVKAKSVLNIGKPLESIKFRLALHKILDDSEAINSNFNALWGAIEKISDSSIIKTLAQPQTPELRGWLELSLIARRSNMLPVKMEPWIQQWHTVYQDHSATAYASTLLLQSKDIYITPTKIALMLPLKGKLSKVATAIQDGFLYAYYSSSDAKAEIEIISIDPDKDFKQQYDLAIQNGADFVVGPLNKKAITELSFSGRLDVPTLALNYANHKGVTQNLFQYGLRPEDEAKQVADYALLNQNYSAAILMPNTTWGTRLSTAFKQRYERLGGSVYSEAQYPAKANDYGDAIKRLLNLNDSKSRHGIIQAVIGEKAAFQPRRRQDIDMIFIGANARQARIIKPQLKFHYAQDIQVYATSHISNSKAKKSADNDRDLNGVYYVEMPWALHSNTLKEAQDINKHWPVLNKSHSRLFALGIDAYRLIPQLKRLQLNPDEQYQGLTGNLSVNENGQIRRELLLATYVKGKAIDITDQLTE